MKLKVTIRRTEKADVQFLAENIRWEDKREIEALGVSPF